MIFEAITTVVMGGLALQAHLSRNGATNDSQKLNKIFSLSGLNIRDGKQTYTTQLVKKNVHGWGTEYKYRIPLGRSFQDYQDRIQTIQDGLNNKRHLIRLTDLKEISFGRDLLPSIKDLHTKRLSQRKEVELSFDGLLCVRVYNEALLTQLPFSTSENWRVLIGITREKNGSIEFDFEKIPHLALGGATRYGKSNLINCIIAALIHQQPNHVKFHLIDLKGGIELCDYENIHQTISIAYEPSEALKTLKTAYEEMRSVQRKLRGAGKKNVQEGNIPIRHFVIIDEVGELNPLESTDKADKMLKVECQKYMSQIARLGAGLGFRLILATQYPTGDVIPRQCKQNSDGKICFRVQSEVASRVVLDSAGAEKLPEVKGRAILQLADKRLIVQTPLIQSKTIKDTISPHVRNEVRMNEKHFHTQPTEREYTFKLEETGLS